MLANDICCALDPALFAREQLNMIPDAWQDEILRESSPRILLNCSRQSGKSTTASILSLHQAIYVPSSLILLVSPSLRQSAELFRKVMQSLKFLLCPPKLVEDSKLSLQLENGSRVVSLPGSEGTIRGFSNVDLIIEDEATRVEDDLYRALRPMLAVSKGRLILMSTPFGKRGHFYNEWDGGQHWKRVKIPATECPRIPKDFLEEERASLGEWWFQQEYMCEFVETEDQFFSHDLIMEAIDHETERISIF